MNTCQRAEETWTDQGKNGQPTSMKEEQACKPGAPYDDDDDGDDDEQCLAYYHIIIALMRSLMML
jgi:hypothetical protein